MKIHREYKQQSEAWMLARAGVATASEFDQLVTPKFELRKGQMPDSYLAAKLAERWLGGPLPGFTAFATEQGAILEEECIPWLEFEWSVPIDRVGFITTDDGRAGCSPDGLIGDIGVEIKCPQPQNHVKYLLKNVVPDDYLLQVHGSMYVTGLKQWRFVSYRRLMPPLVLTVERDEAVIAVIDEAVTLFVDRLDRAYERLVELNGGEPSRKAT